jgi:DNA repair exonuclease SbcCD ATPase subunit
MRTTTLRHTRGRANLAAATQTHEKELAAAHTAFEQERDLLQKQINNLTEQLSKAKSGPGPVTGTAEKAAVDKATAEQQQQQAATREAELRRQLQKAFAEEKKSALAELEARLQAEHEAALHKLQAELEREQQGIRTRLSEAAAERSELARTLAEREAALSEREAELARLQLKYRTVARRLTTSTRYEGTLFPQLQVSIHALIMQVETAAAEVQPAVEPETPAGISEPVFIVPMAQSLADTATRVLERLLLEKEELTLQETLIFQEMFAEEGGRRQFSKIFEDVAKRMKVVEISPGNFLVLRTVLNALLGQLDITGGRDVFTPRTLLKSAQNINTTKDGATTFMKAEMAKYKVWSNLDFWSRLLSFITQQTAIACLSPLTPSGKTTSSTNCMKGTASSSLTM